MVDILEVQKIIGNAKVCWGCLSSTCLTRQLISGRMTKNKLLNRYCATRKVLLGDKILLTSLQSKVGKDNQVAAYDPKKKKGEKKKFKGKLNHFSVAIVKKPTTEKEVPTEIILA